MLPHHEKVEQDTIRVVRGTSVKVPHYMGLALFYPMENDAIFTSHFRMMGV